MARVYLETSFVSACVTTRTDAASVYRRQASRDWWNTQSSAHQLYVSAEVISELSAPSYPTSAGALRWIEGVPLLDIDEDVLGFAEILVQHQVMPSPVAGDALHVAIACVHDLDYILSWNVRHLANPNKLTHLRTVCIRAGCLPPRIVTPEFLWEDTDEPA